MATSTLKANVSKSGDTMSGKLIVNNSSSDEGLVVSKNHTGTTSALANITVGNNISNGTAGSCYGGIAIFGKSNRYTLLQSTAVASSNKTIELPNKSGTIALTSDLPVIRKYSVVLSGSTNVDTIVDSSINATTKVIGIAIQTIRGGMDMMSHFKSISYGGSGTNSLVITRDEKASYANSELTLICINM